MNPTDIHETSIKCEQDEETVVDGLHIEDPSKPDHDADGCISKVDSAYVDPEESISKSEHDPETTTSGKPRHELGNVTDDMYTDVPKPEEDRGVVSVGAHIEVFDETEQDSTTGAPHVTINDPSNSKEDPVSVSLNDSDLYNKMHTKQNPGGYEGTTSTTFSLSSVVVSTPLVTSSSTKLRKGSTPKKISITAGDGQKYIKSGEENVDPVTDSNSSKQSARIILPPNVRSNGSPIVSSKLRTVTPDNVSCGNKVKIKRAGPIIVRTIGPRTVRNISVSKSAVDADPAGPILITREMDDGRMLDPVRARDVTTPQKSTTKKILVDAPASSRITLQDNEQGDLATSDNRPVASQENFENFHSCNDEVLITRQLDDELAASENIITTDENKCVIEITGKIANRKAVSEVDGPSHDIQDGSNRSCCFCRSVLSREDRITYLPLNKPLPSSLVDPISLLHCLGISSPVLSVAPTIDNATVILCQQCYSLVSDGDLVYQRLLSVTSEMRQHWPESESGEILNVPLGFDSNKKALKAQMCEGVQNIQPLQSYPSTKRKCRPILPKPSMAQESLSMRSSDIGNVEVRIKQEPSNYKMRICGFCGMDLYGEEDWRLHSAAVHRVEQKWRMFNVQPTLKTLLAKEIQRSTLRQRGDKQNWRCGKASTRKCIACSRDFSLRDEFVEHLRHYHNMVIDEEFLSYVSEDADVMEWSNSCQNGITDSPVQVKCEGVCIEQERTRSPISGMVEDVSIHGCNPLVCESKGEQNIINNPKEEVKETLQVDALPAPDDCHNYIGTHGNKGTTAHNTGSSKKFQGPTWCCRLCGNLYSSKMDLDKHKHSEHPGSVRIIKKRRIDDDDSKSSPADIHSIPLILRSKTKVNCRLCSKGFDSQEALNSHIDTCHENSVVILEKDGCGGVIDHRLDMSKALDSLEEHEQEAEILEPQGMNLKKRPDRTRNFVCNSCGDAFVNRLLLVKHKRSVHGDVCGVGGANGLVMVECEICGRRLHGIGSLRHHLSKAHNRSHRPPLKHRCKMCIYHSRTRNQLEKHMQEKHGVSVLPPVECKDCGKMYNAKYIDIHIANIHENQRKYSCNFCAMKFNIKSSLKCHISYEHANNKWHCDKCNTEFDKYHKLRQHRIYVHSTKLFPCSECGKTYKRKSDLTTHGKRRHQERIPCECTYCPKAYTDQKKLRTHLIKKHGVAWEDTLSKSYARHQRENNCLRRRQVRNSRTSQNAAHSEEASGTEIQQNQYEFEKHEDLYYEQEQGDGFYKEQYLHDHPHQNYQVRHCAQLGEGTITTYEGADIGTLEDQREYNVVQVNEASESLTNVADISYIILEETQ